MSRLQDKSVPFDGFIEIDSRHLERRISIGWIWEPNGIKARYMDDGSDLSLSDRIQAAYSLCPKGSEIGKSYKQVMRYINGADVPYNFLVKLSVYSGVPLDWITTGRESISLCRVFEPSYDVLVKVPFLSTKPSAGSGNLPFDDAEENEFPIAILRESNVKEEHARVMIASGDSMMPTIGDGDRILVDASKTDPIDGKIYVFSVRDFIFCKRLRRSTDGWVIHSDNTAIYPPSPFSDPDAIIHGQVVWVGRRLGG